MFRHGTRVYPGKTGFPGFRFRFLDNLKPGFKPGFLHISQVPANHELTRKTNALGKLIFNP